MVARRKAKTGSLLWWWWDHLGKMQTDIKKHHITCGLCIRVCWKTQIPQPSWLLSNSQDLVVSSMRGLHILCPTKPSTVLPLGHMWGLNRPLGIAKSTRQATVCGPWPDLASQKLKKSPFLEDPKQHLGWRVRGSILKYCLLDRWPQDF